jgi:hypothetical protein
VSDDDVVITSTRASVMTFDFKHVPDIRQQGSGRLMDDKKKVDSRPIDSKGRLLTPRQIRARARRRVARRNHMTDQEFEAMYKPLEEWDVAELARGRPRNAAGRFHGPAPKWISREVHERSMALFKDAIKIGMNDLTPSAVDAIRALMISKEKDDKGRPTVPPSTKLDAAKFLLEHTVGKPTVTVQTDISVKLQGILGQVMVNPAKALEAGDYTVAHLPGVTLPMGEIEDDYVDADIVEEA